MDTAPLTIKVIAGSTREGRFSDQAALWIKDELMKQEGVVAEVLDLRDYDMPFFNHAVSPSFKSEPYMHEAVARFTNKIGEADGFVMVTPEYNHSTSAVLKNAIDWVYQEWNKKPVAFVSYGSVGGARAVEHLRLIAVEMQMAPTRTAVHISGEQYFPMRFGSGDPTELFIHMTPKAIEVITELLWWTKALKNARETQSQ